MLLSAVVMIGCAGQYQQMPSKNVGERIKLVVIHYTAIDYQKSVHTLVDEGGLSSHYLVTDPNDASFDGDNASVIQLVDESRRAWHAGKGQWQGRNHLNDTSIGIEVVNVSHCEVSVEYANAPGEHSRHRLCTYPDYHPQQIEQIISLMQGILLRNPDITPTAIVGHADIAFSRKSDPGPRFPWYQLYLAGIGAWYDAAELKEHWEQFTPALPSVGLMQAALQAYGYGVVETGIADEQTIDALFAFQMHFVQDNVSGTLDSETAATLFALLEKYFPQKHRKLMARYTNEQQRLAAGAAEPQVKLGQIDAVFPQQDRSTRTEVNDKLGFKAFKGQGEMLLTPHSTTQAQIKINGELLTLDDPLEAGQTYTYSLQRRTHTGTNTFELVSLSAPEDTLQVVIPWPVLTDATQKWQSEFTEVDKLINQDIEDGFPGAVLLVIKDGQIVKRTAYGNALKFDENGQPLANPQPMMPGTLFDVASNTKMFATNLALMKLVSEGKLDVDTPLYHYLPEYTGDGREARTVRDLLSHHSGYGPEVRFFEPGPGRMAKFKSRDKQHTSTLLTTAVPFREGNRQHTAYSDTNFMLLGLLVERITGMSLDRYCEQFIYAPLRLNHTLFNPLEKGILPSQIAATEINGNSRSGHITFPGIRTHTLRGEVHDEKAWYSMGGVSGHAGLFSNVDDFAVLMQMLINGGGYDKVTMLDKDTLSLFTAPSSANQGFGLGWRRAADGRNRWHFGPYASSTAFGHTGWTGTATVIDPAQNLAIVLFTNARHTPVENTANGGLTFAGSQFETAGYGSVITRIYEALLNH
ncbi:penicillin binding protein PBP4B [Alteromonas confluentis]|nr:penicillin binding protein PBP4B [Alteromonas confluentis]